MPPPRVKDVIKPNSHKTNNTRQAANNKSSIFPPDLIKEHDHFNSFFLYSFFISKSYCSPDKPYNNN